MVSVESPKHLFPRPTLEINTIFFVISLNSLLQLKAVRKFFFSMRNEKWEMKTSPLQGYVLAISRKPQIFFRNTVIPGIITCKDILEIIVMINILRRAKYPLPKQIVEWTNKSFS